MKPQPLPEGASGWEKWPRLEDVQRESGLSISRLRKLLVKVPCYRCTDSTTRYEPKATAAVLYDDDGDEDDDQDAAELSEMTADALSSKQGPFALVCMLVREQMRMNAETRRERQDVVKVMQDPLEAGLKLLRDIMDVQAKRLTHLEGVWDRMIENTEATVAMQHARELENRKVSDSAAMRARAASFLERHGPMIIAKYGLSTQATEALDFLATLDPKIVELVSSSGVLTPDQEARLARILTGLDKLRPKPEPKPEPPEQQPS